MPNKQRPTRNYSKETRDICLEIAMKERKKRVIPLSTFTKQLHTPSKASVYRWRNNILHPKPKAHPPPKLGRPPKLSEGELHVVVGWIITRDRASEKSSGNHTVDFVREAFGVRISKGTLSKLLNKVGISSHWGKRRDIKYERPRQVSTLLKYAIRLRREIEGVDLSRIVTVDGVKFSSYGKLIRTYAPKGKILLNPSPY